MKVTPIKTPVIHANEQSLLNILDRNLPALQEGSVLAITSKIVSLCEGSVAPEALGKDALMREHADMYIPASENKYGFGFMLIKGTIIANAGIDASNADGQLVLWPRDAQGTANTLRKHLRETYNLQNLGVIITDSTSRPMRLGATGIGLAFSGFVPVHSYATEPDLFGRTLQTDTADILDGLAAAAVLAMGEGAEQTPLALIEDVPFVQFKDSDPDEHDLKTLNITLEDDLFAPFINNDKWQKNTDG